eukprot:TRINITY_DN4880_c1_g1_i1.p1 TRINITY_DN4880_c1_g1~~TRINITY_DN4880_c1_g1_i1.p1  ORF type:complete len:281 (+),score=62.25 TRINITY_DN4880_c1_g1_i1:58-900(+)
MALYSESEKEEMNSFIQSMLDDKSGLPTDAEGIQGIEDFISGVLETGRMEREFDSHIRRSSLAIEQMEDDVDRLLAKKNKPKKQRRGKYAASDSSSDISDSDSDLVIPKKKSPPKMLCDGKVQIFVSMQGCPLLKSLLVAKDASFYEFMSKIEIKLNEQDLLIFYEDAEGDRIEIDDDESVAVFLEKTDGLESKVKLIAFPAEVVAARMGRTIVSQNNIPHGLGSCTARNFETPRCIPSARGPQTARGEWKSTIGSVDMSNYNPNATLYGRRGPAVDVSA